MRAAALQISGLAVGLRAALIVLRLFATAVVGVSHTDPLTFLTATAAMFVAAVVAAGVLALLASRVDPAIAFARNASPDPC